MKVPERIGPYRILSPLGEGGMGQVYLAEQREPVRRRVALKLIKPGMDSKEVLARFEAERQAVALMDHPSIARVYDAGTTDAGLPYFVMELVEGKPVTTFCDDAKLPLKKRLQLFQQICDGVQHAHQKGIIHRDIKPSNILVVKDEKGEPVPKIIDFGVAKALGPGLTEATLFTVAGQVIGTPQYMSPEQANLGAKDIDTRTDIYSLGVLLYELLTGRTPLEVSDMQKVGLDAMLRTIREVEAPRPSTKLSSLEQDTKSIVAGNLKIPPSKLHQSLRGDLDWIVMKALEKERHRRYETAYGFSLDVDRFLANEPVSATPPSIPYRVKKTVQRNKLAFATFAFLLVGLGAGLFATIHQENRAIRQRELANQTQDNAEVLVGEMLGSIKLELSEVGRLDLLRDVSLATESYFKGLEHRNGKIEDSSAFVRMLSTRASVLFSEGKDEAAADHWDRALSVALRLLKEDQSNSHLLSMIGDIYSGKCRLAFQSGDFKGAGKASELYRELAIERLAKPDPDYDDFRAAAAACLIDGMAGGPDSPSLHQAINYADRALAVRPEATGPVRWKYQAWHTMMGKERDDAARSTASKNAVRYAREGFEITKGEDASFVKSLSLALLHSSWIHFSEGRKTGDKKLISTGLAQGEEGMQHLKRLVDLSPDNRQLNVTHAFSYQTYGMMLLKTGDIENGKKSLESFQTEFAALKRDTPFQWFTTKNFLHNAGVSAVEILRRGSLDPEWGARFVEDSITIFDHSSPKAQARAIHFEGYADCLATYAELCLVHGIEDRLDWFGRIQSMLKNPPEPESIEDSLRISAQSLNSHTTALMALAQGEYEKDPPGPSKKWLEEAEARLIEGVQKRPRGTLAFKEDHSVADSPADTLLALGNLSWKLDHPDIGERIEKLAIQWQDEMHEAGSENQSEHGRNRIKARLKLAGRLKDLGREEEAIRLLEDAVDIGDFLWESQFPRDAELIAGATVELARLHKQVGNLEEAARVSQDLLDKGSKNGWGDVDGENRITGQKIAAAHEMIGLARQDQGEWDKAETPYRKSLATFESLASRFPDPEFGFASYAARSKVRLAQVYANTNRWSDPQRREWLSEAVAALVPLETSKTLPQSMEWVLNQSRNHLKKMDAQTTPDKSDE